MKKGVLPYCLLCVCCFLSCVKEVFVEIRPGDSKLVLNASLSPDEEFKVHIGKTGGTGSGFSDFKIQTKAKIQVFVDDKLKGVMIPVEDIVDPDSLSQYDKGSLYVLPGVSPRPGERIRIEAEADGFDKVLARTEIPEAPVLLSVDTVRYVANHRGDEKLRLYVKIKDTQNVPDYYRIMLSREERVEDADNHATDTSVNYRVISLDYEDPVFASDLPFQTSGIAKHNQYGIFTDNLFDGNEYVLKVSFSDSGENCVTGSAVLNVKYQIILYTVCESYYNFYKQANNLTFVVGDIELIPTRDSFLYYTNVENGFGLAYSYNKVVCNIGICVNRMQER